MSSENHQHGHDHHHDNRQRHSAAWRRWHRNWKAWVIVGLMLAAMFAYVMSDDESLQPGSNTPGPRMPAAAGM